MSAGPGRTVVALYEGTESAGEVALFMSRRVD
ncbi:hypothetical protein STEPF1_04307 [Streptomyces sp. F-1]|nr:hypothetical protein STEPF1_04307 [Streptomyces sp. F-1]